MLGWVSQPWRTPRLPSGLHPHLCCLLPALFSPSPPATTSKDPPSTIVFAHLLFMLTPRGRFRPVPSWLSWRLPPGLPSLVLSILILKLVRIMEVKICAMLDFQPTWRIWTSVSQALGFNFPELDLSAPRLHTSAPPPPPPLYDPPHMTHDLLL